MSLMLRINISNLIAHLMHVMELTDFNLKWFQALLYPLYKKDGLLDAHYSAYEKDIYKLTHNGQTCHLRGMLNDTFDSTLRRITVFNASRKDVVLFYPKENSSDVVLMGEVLFHPREVVGYGTADFYVKVPTDIIMVNDFAKKTDVQLRMESLLDFYKLDPKRYKIVN